MVMKSEESGEERLTFMFSFPPVDSSEHGIRQIHTDIWRGKKKSQIFTISPQKSWELNCVLVDPAVIFGYAWITVRVFGFKWITEDLCWFKMMYFPNTIIDLNERNFILKNKTIVSTVST